MRLYRHDIRLLSALYAISIEDSIVGNDVIVLNVLEVDFCRAVPECDGIHCLFLSNISWPIKASKIALEAWRPAIGPDMGFGPALLIGKPGKILIVQTYPVAENTAILVKGFGLLIKFKLIDIEIDLAAEGQTFHNIYISIDIAK